MFVTGKFVRMYTSFDNNITGTPPILLNQGCSMRVFDVDQGEELAMCTSSSPLVCLFAICG